MKKYKTEGLRAISAENMSDAAAIFAERIAKKQHGKSSYCRTITLMSWAQDFSLGEYSAFIGCTPAGKHNRGTTVGNNIVFSVRTEEATK